MVSSSQVGAEVDQEEGRSHVPPLVWFELHVEAGKNCTEIRQVKIKYIIFMVVRGLLG